ncbi:hypothetical protein GH714_014327 [Hevea brasiliensis]|uniref:Uncharacterized protein n=1 Tax=Hevea brasiliensis TaxID=3981 RepID=A0A6A6KNK2_HEVBR|nr:hypothetical protein GH714_014327 [Hevea brasiliensis]
MGRLSGSQESSPALRLPLLVLMGNDEDALAMAELATDEDGPNTQPASAQLFEKLETTQENFIFHVLPLLVRAYDDTDLRIQEEVLKNLHLLLSNSMFRIIEKIKKGVIVTDSGIPEVMTAPFPNGLQSQALSKTSGTVAPASKTNNCIMPLVDIEWPPQASSGVTPQLRDADKQLNTGASSSSSFDDLDPFANWPPRPSGTSSASGTSNNVSLGSMGNNYSTSSNASTPNSMNFQANGNNSWAFSNQSSSELLKSNKGFLQ